MDDGGVDEGFAQLMEAARGRRGRGWGVRLFVCPVLRQQGGGGWLSTEVIQESFKKLEKKDCMLRHIAVVQYAVNSK